LDTNLKEQKEKGERMTNHESSFQKVSAIFGLMAGFIMIIFLIANVILYTPEADLTPESLVQGAKDNQYLLFFYSLIAIAMLFFGVLLHGIKERFNKLSVPLASLNLHLGWLTVLLKILVITANWLHIYLNAVVWDAETAHQFSRLTYNASTYFHMSSLPFLAGWLIVTGIGGIVSKGFSKPFSVLSIIFGGCVALEFLGWQWEVFVSIPLLFGYVTTYAWVMLIWASIEILLRKSHFV
jgi:hypothetical protein